MKILSVITMSFALLASASAIAKTPSAPQHSTTKAPVAQLSLSVKGMTCESCEEKVAEALKKIDGVADAKADHKKGVALITLKGDAKPNVMAMKKAIRDLGYEVQ